MTIRDTFIRVWVEETHAKSSVARKYRERKKIARELEEGDGLVELVFQEWVKQRRRITRKRNMQHDPS